MLYSEYKIRYTKYARDTARKCARYLMYEVGLDGNLQAAINFERELSETVRRIKISAESYGYIDNVVLRGLGLRKIHFPRMHYKIIFHIAEDIVYIDAVFHDSQDYESILAG